MELQISPEKINLRIIALEKNPSCDRRSVFLIHFASDSVT